MQEEKLSPYASGLYVSEWHGIYKQKYILEIAEANGFMLPEGSDYLDYVVDAYYNPDILLDSDEEKFGISESNVSEIFHEIVDDAESWMNGKLAPKGYAFFSLDSGDWGLWQVFCPDCEVLVIDENFGGMWDPQEEHEEGCSAKFDTERMEWFL